MAFPSETYKASFWEKDFLDQTGFETVVSHIKDGQRSCKWLEEYLKQRAKAEEDYAKALLKISKSTVNEFGTLRKALEELRTESEAEASLHLNISSKIQEEVSKLERFKERQREERKKNEDIVHKSHKTKAEQYRRMQNCKNTYESRFKAAEKAESDSNKLKFGAKPKDAERARKQAVQARSNAIKADEDYKLAVSTVETVRKQWVNDHANSCDELQRMEEERITFMRNSVWIFANLVSELCCKVDDSREKIRLVTEKCDVYEDIKSFVNQKSTSIKPLPPVEYTPCGSFISPGQAPSVPLPPTPQATPQVNGGHIIYEMGMDPERHSYIAIYGYGPTNADEIELKEGDEIQPISAQDTEKGWLRGKNVRTNAEGLFPENYVKLKE